MRSLEPLTGSPVTGPLGPPVSHPVTDAAGMAPAWVRSRLVAVILVAGALALSQSARVLGTALAVGLATMLVRLIQARRTPGLRASLVRRVLTIAGFAGLIWLSLPWVWREGGLALSATGIELAIVTSLRVAAIGTWTLVLLSGLSGVDLGEGLARLGAPHRLVLLLQLTVRYVALLGASQRRLDRAMRARGFRPRTDRWTATVLARQMALVLAHAILRARRVGVAMRARGAGFMTNAGEDRGA